MVVTKASFLKGCQSRKQLYLCNADKYTTCVNRYHLLSKVVDPVDVSAAYTYPAFWRRFDFICNGGFEIFSDPSNFATIVTTGMELMDKPV
uniref:Uncharacterized protein n=1 Tax=Rhabditophanes sp. KR3021 TaxID=114890 RepID=A0AC35TNA4_9BILA